MSWLFWATYSVLCFYTCVSVKIALKDYYHYRICGDNDAAEVTRWLGIFMPILTIIVVFFLAVALGLFGGL